MQVLRRALLASLSSVALACVADVESEPSRISAPRLIAVLSEPAEVEPGQEVHYRALLVSAEGPSDAPDARWAYCTTPRALSENTSVAKACAVSDELPLATRGLELDARVPRDACARFGSESSGSERPHDPDHTGGYYQPLRLSTEGVPSTVLRQRILCPLANAPIDVAQEFARNYVVNEPPAITHLTLRVDGAPVRDDTLRPETRIELTLTLAEDAHEQYPHYLPGSGALETRHEAISAQWFSSGGTLAEATSEVPESQAQNALDTPAAAGDFWLWVVVRDERGGVSALERRLTVTAKSP